LQSIHVLELALLIFAFMGSFGAFSKYRKEKLLIRDPSLVQRRRKKCFLSRFPDTFAWRRYSIEGAL
jgi:hypothetical protein